MSEGHLYHVFPAIEVSPDGVELCGVWAFQLGEGETAQDAEEGRIKNGSCLIRIPAKYWRESGAVRHTVKLVLDAMLKYEFDKAGVKDYTMVKMDKRASQDQEEFEHGSPPKPQAPPEGGAGD